jgi:hypothetical protein
LTWLLSGSPTAPSSASRARMREERERKNSCTDTHTRARARARTHAMWPPYSDPVHLHQPCLVSSPLCCCAIAASNEPCCLSAGVAAASLCVILCTVCALTHPRPPTLPIDSSQMLSVSCSLRQAQCVGTSGKGALLPKGHPCTIQSHTRTFVLLVVCPIHILLP